MLRICTGIHFFADPDPGQNLKTDLDPGSGPYSEYGSKSRRPLNSDPVRIQIRNRDTYRYNVVVCQEPGENQRGGCQQAAVQHGLQLQGDGAQHGHHDCRIRQEGTRALLCGQVIC